ncbi:hypothetical protein LCGC14_1155280 [marine sediment metagenome]|uniref:Erf family protein n=1 Tax=marine sediment metagenome TaxID=412755 RepID=A0A0F9PZQ4_9ZZZZ
MENDKKIYAAMVAIMREVVVIGKDQENKSQNFKYRSIDDVYSSMHTLLAKHGVFMTPEVIDIQREERKSIKGNTLIYSMVRVRYTYWADDGSSVQCVGIGEGMDSGDKSVNKAMAGAHKYMITQTFIIPTSDPKDPDADSHEVQTRAKAEPNKPEPRPAPEQAAAPTNGDTASKPQKSAIFAIEKRFEGKPWYTGEPGFFDHVASGLLGRPISSHDDLTKNEASRVIDFYQALKDGDSEAAGQVEGWLIGKAS